MSTTTWDTAIDLSVSFPRARAARATATDRARRSRTATPAPVRPAAGPAVARVVPRPSAPAGPVATAGTVAHAPGAQGRGVAAVRPAPATSGAVHLTARGRAVLVVLGLVLAVTGALTAGSAAADDPAAGLPVSAVTVAPGDTLWGIAAELAAPGEDVRVVVDRLAELNGGLDAGLQAGQQILVPAP